MSWFSSFWKWLVGLIVHESIEQVKEEIKQPSTITDENVPKTLRDDLDADLAAKLREANRNNHSQGSGPTG